MSKIAIVTDSTACLPKTEVASMKNVTVVPITVTIDNTIYREGIDISDKEFYARLAKASKLPTTAPPTIQQMLDTYTSLEKQGYEAIISIHLTAGISDFVNNLKMAVQSFQRDNVFVLDSHITVQAMGYLVRYASYLAKHTLSAEDIVDKVVHLRNTIDEYFVVDDLKNLVTGGRLTNGAAFAGRLLRIKPILTLNDECKIVAIDKIKTMKRALRFLSDAFQKAEAKSKYPLHVMVTGTNNLPEVEKWCEQLQLDFPLATFETGQIGPVVGTHVGSNAFAILWCQEIKEIDNY